MECHEDQVSGVNQWDATMKVKVKRRVSGKERKNINSTRTITRMKTDSDELSGKCPGESRKYVMTRPDN